MQSEWKFEMDKELQISSLDLTVFTPENNGYFQAGECFQ